MRLFILAAVVATFAAACTQMSDDLTVQTPAPPVTTSTTTIVDVPPSLADYAVENVLVGDRELLLAIADGPSLRRQGLQGVTDLLDLDGMLFFWRHDGDTFWMKDTLVPLDIVWFNEDGTYKDRASMVPCAEDPCVTYSPAGGLDFRFAIEAKPGDLDFINESTVITYSD